MRVYATVHTHNKIIKKFTAESDHPDISRAFLECSEQIYKALDLSEPVWLYALLIKLYITLPK